MVGAVATEPQNRGSYYDKARNQRKILITTCVESRTVLRRSVEPMLGTYDRSEAYGVATQSFRSDFHRFQITTLVLELEARVFEG